MQKYTIQELFEDTDKFNSIAGAYNDLSKESFDGQFKIIQEEFKEFSDGHELNDLVEICDGLVDSYVTLFGYQRKLEEKYGIDFSSIMRKIAENNLSKFPNIEKSMQGVVINTVRMYLDKDTPVKTEFNEEYEVFVIKDARTGKVKKPIDFVPVDITKEVLGE